MNGCKHCGGCGSCEGCGALELNGGELDMLKKLGQIPFLPVARSADSAEPVYLEDGDCTLQEYSLILQCLEKKGLISIDYDMPLKGWDYCAYDGYPVRGSFALTGKGQKVLEILELEGIPE